MSNPLLSIGTQPIPFPELSPEQYASAIEKRIQEAKGQIDELVANPEKPTFANTVEKLEFIGLELNRISGALFNLNSAETNPEIQSVCQRLAPVLTNFSNDIRLNQKLFARIKSVYDANPKLTPEQERLLSETYKGFERNGALLDEQKKTKLRKIDEALSIKSLKFGENVLAETQAFTLPITEESDLTGLPDSVRNQAKKEANAKQESGWLFTLNYPSYIPFMKFSEKRKLREKMYRAFGAKGFQQNAHNNETNILEIVNLRRERAQLLGYNSHADFVLENRMAGSALSVRTFLDELREHAMPIAQKELEELKRFAKNTDDLEELMPWDHAFYSEKLRQKNLALSEEQLKPYFSLESVLEGAFSVAQRLYGIHFRRTEEVPVYHPDVRVYEVLDANDSFLSLLYCDFHPRPGKRSGAWMTSYLSQYGEVRPHVSIVCNFTPAQDNLPALLDFQEVTTLFHEFGHALHGMLANTIYPSLSGTSVYWDFVELPSQFMENFCYEKSVLQSFAKHYETGEVIPEKEIQKLQKARKFMAGYQTVRQVGLALLDMHWHSMQDTFSDSVAEAEKRATASTKLYPNIPETLTSTSFSHIFQGGYSAGYYSYKWAEVLDSDAFAYFEEQGLFNAEVATKFKNLLQKGGTQDPMELYIAFRGKKPSNTALLKRIS